MTTADFAQTIAASHQAIAALMQGDPTPLGALFSRRADATLANPFGPPAQGWPQIEQTLARAAAHFRAGEVIGIERLAAAETAELAYLVEIQRVRVKVGDASMPTPLAFRETTIFRREDGTWTIVHRHVDPIMTPRPAASVMPPNA